MTEGEVENTQEDEPKEDVTQESGDTGQEDEGKENEEKDELTNGKSSHEDGVDGANGANGGPVSGKKKDLVIRKVHSMVSRILYENLCDGFQKLKAARMNGNQHRRTAPLEFLPVHSFVTVNFIDPTTTSPAPSESSGNQNPGSGKFSFMTPLGGKGSAEQKFALNLYEKLVTIFRRDYISTLHSVPCENVRSGSPGHVDSLPVHTVLTQSHGTRNAANGDAQVPWGGNSGAAAAPVSDPAEWHNGPYCHVYIAACESMDHYRQKIRPSIQAFVSQIEGASGIVRNQARITPVSTTGNYSTHYVILYVPIRNADGSSQSEKQAEQTMGNRLGGVIASRMAAARRQITNSASRELSDSIHSSSSNMHGDDGDDPSSAPPPGPIAHTSKAERELFRKLSADFPNGRTCILSTLMDSANESSATTTSPLKNQEWNNFLRMLGGAIVSGFRDRCRRYDEELRRLDAARANRTKAKSKSPGKDSRFDMGHFFLVKESLAFTYEQMQMPSEALLQYEELRAFLPEVSGEDPVMGTMIGKEAAEKAANAFSSAEAIEQAVAGDAIEFRKRLRSVSNLGLIENTIFQYLYSREISLLFQMSDPLEVLKRSYSFVQVMYKLKRKSDGQSIEEPSNANEDQLKIKAEIWALSFCWDVKRACDTFFEVLNVNKDESVREFSFSRLENADMAEFASDHTDVNPVQQEFERRLASRVGEIMEFARQRFLKLGDLRLGDTNPIRKLTRDLPTDMMEEWDPWKPTAEDGQSDILTSMQEEKDMNQDMLSIKEDLLDDAFDSLSGYELRYLEIASTVARLHRLAERRRMSSRLQAEKAEIYMKRGDYRKAILAMLPIVDVCATDRWDRCHFWHLFRLACCQRRAGKVPAYLNTLTLCFGPHITPIAPKSALIALQKDFEAVVAHPQVSLLRLGTSSFLETDLGVSQTSNGKSSMLLNFVRKKFVKSFCTVGEPVSIQLSMNSHLPNPISVEKVSLLLVSFDRFEELFHSRQPVKNDDAFELLQLDSPVTVNPGINTYDFQWTPMSTGIFTLATIQLQWRSACFHYDSAALRKPLLGIDVLPSSATQTIELSPLFLIPGQTQQVRITFNSGSDNVREGKVELLCSEGLKVLPPGHSPDSDAWESSCAVDLPNCEAGGSVVLTTTVKSAAPKMMDSKLRRLPDSKDRRGAVQTMQAKVTTFYNHGLYKPANGDEDPRARMQAVLDAMVTTLDKPAFTVDECSTNCYSDEHVLVTLLLHCNTPVPFSLKEWSISIPKLTVDKDGDMNAALFDYAIAEGEQLALSFNCVRDANCDKQTRPSLALVLQDEFGKTFNQVLPLDFAKFYQDMACDEEFQGANSVMAELTCAATSGLVGGPVCLTYTVDGSGLSTPPKRQNENSAESDLRMLYKVSPIDTDWIVGGKVNGILDFTTEKKHVVKLYGIPVRPGLLTRFPTLSMQYATTEEESPPMTVYSRNPDFFKSLSYVNHMALACPVGSDG